MTRMPDELTRRLLRLLPSSRTTSRDFFSQDGNLHSLCVIEVIIGGGRVPASAGAALWRGKGRKWLGLQVSLAEVRWKRGPGDCPLIRSAQVITDSSVATSTQRTPLYTSTPPSPPSLLSHTKTNRLTSLKSRRGWRLCVSATVVQETTLD